MIGRSYALDGLVAVAKRVRLSAARHTGFLSDLLLAAEEVAVMPSRIAGGPEREEPSSSMVRKGRSHLMHGEMANGLSVGTKIAAKVLLPMRGKGEEDLALRGSQIFHELEEFGRPARVWNNTVVC